MAFEVWDIDGAQWTEGINASAAIFQSIGEAALSNRLRIYELQEGSNDLTVPELYEQTGERIGITVCTPHIAFCYGGRLPPRHTARHERWSLQYAPRLRILPQEAQGFPLCRSSAWNVQNVRVQLFRYVRYVEGTPELTDIAQQLQKP